MPDDTALQQFPILVAVTSDELATSVVSLAEALAELRHAAPMLLCVEEFFPYPAMDVGLVAPMVTAELFNPVLGEVDKGVLRKRCCADAGVPATWPFEVEFGPPASLIAERARQAGAKLILTGLHHHGAVARVLGNDTVRNVMASSATPVLAARPELTALPKRVVVAVDFSRASIRAAHLARDLMDETGELHVVFVTAPEPDDSEQVEGRHRIERAGIEAGFRDIVAALQPAPGMHIATHLRTGAVIPELERACEELHAELVAIGSQRHNFLDRLTIGSVAAAIVGTGRWSVLVTPPAPRGAHVP